MRITILIASAYVNAAVTARSLKYLTTLANGPLEEIRTPAPQIRSLGRTLEITEVGYRKEKSAANFKNIFLFE